jgi:hypothetical protein
MPLCRGTEKLSNYTPGEGSSAFYIYLYILLTGADKVCRWEKAHYYLGKHYNKIIESEKAKPLGKEAQI